VLPSGLGTPNSLFSWPTGHEHREAHHEPVHHGLRQELRDEAQPDDARQQEHQARDQHEGGGDRVGLRVGRFVAAVVDQGRGTDEASSAPTAEVPRPSGA